MHPSRQSLTIPPSLFTSTSYSGMGMSEIDLYDATRGVWRLNPKIAADRLAMAVFDGVIQEVYDVKQWLPAGSTYSTRGRLRSRDRWSSLARSPQAAFGTTIATSL